VTWSLVSRSWSAAGENPEQPRGPGRAQALDDSLCPQAERLAMRLWTIRAWKRDAKLDRVYAAEASFTSDVETIEEAYQLAYSYGFACLHKLPDGDIVAAAQLSVSMSSRQVGSDSQEQEASCTTR
jgi:hypothetical protein